MNKYQKWKEIQRERIPNSVTIHPSSGGPGHYTYAVARYRIAEVRTNEQGQEECRVREEYTKAVYLHEHGDLLLAFRVVEAALPHIEKACFDK